MTKKIVENYWTAVNKRDWQTVDTLLAKDVIYILPQTREKIIGSKALCTFNETYPGDWTIMVDTLVADEHQVVSRILFKNNNKTQTGISFHSIMDGLICEITEYWPAPYDPPKRNCGKIERY